MKGGVALQVKIVSGAEGSLTNSRVKSDHVVRHKQGSRLAAVDVDERDRTADGEQCDETGHERLKPRETAWHLRDHRESQTPSIGDPCADDQNQSMQEVHGDLEQDGRERVESEAFDQLSLR